MLNGSVERNFGAWRAWLACSKPDAILINVGSLKAVPMIESPSGNPNENPIGTTTIG